MAGFAGTFSYAVLTDDNLLALTPTNAMLVMLVVPISFTFSQSKIEPLIFETQVHSKVFYHIGVFLSRSSINLVKLNFLCISLLAVVQTATTIVVFFTALYAYIPHFAIICSIMFFVGIVGGANYANTFYHIHRKVDPTIREFALSTVTFADTIGILAAAVAAIPVHNWICAMKWYG
ncbi:CLN3 protein [Teladorsagia circumcincta]|uniref:Battenin n=1 Tax=Teladorsagia circumcincta TaxID=45464 RepID=A0A2G9UZK1_TELCI|nr:CLN3 protein [Teladorsagia circumcincta]